MKESKVKEQPHCLKPSEHGIMHTFFCITCASKNYNCFAVCFCVQCYIQKHKEHKDHKQFYKVESKSFSDQIETFKTYLNKNADSLNLSSKHMSHLLNSQKLNFHNISFKKWLVATQFWKFSSNKTLADAHKNLVELTKSS